MIISTMQDLLKIEKTTRTGSTRRVQRAAFTASTIDTAFNSPNKKLRQRAAATLRSHGVDIEYMKVPAE